MQTPDGEDRGPSERAVVWSQRDFPVARLSGVTTCKRPRRARPEGLTVPRGRAPLFFTVSYGKT